MGHPNHRRDGAGSLGAGSSPPLPDGDEAASLVKYCSKCKVAHPVSAFNRNSRLAAGLMSYCRTAQRAICTAHRARIGHEQARQRYLKSRTSKRPYLRYHSKYNPRPA